MAWLSSVDSATLAELIRANQIEAEHGRRVVVANASARLCRYLRRTGLLTNFELAASEAPALSLFVDDGDRS